MSMEHQLCNIGSLCKFVFILDPLSIKVYLKQICIVKSTIAHFIHNVNYLHRIDLNNQKYTI